MVYLLKIHHALVRVCFDQKISWFCLSGIRIRPVLGPLAILSSPNSECSSHVWIPIYFNTVMRLQFLRRVAQWARMYPKCAKSHFYQLLNFDIYLQICYIYLKTWHVLTMHSFSLKLIVNTEIFISKLELCFIFIKVESHDNDIVLSPIWPNDMSFLRSTKIMK